MSTTRPTPARLTSPLAQARGAYAMFQRKEEGCLKVVLDPGA